MRRAAVLTVSDRGARGETEDLSGPAVATALAAAGWECGARIIPDGADAVETAIRDALTDGARLVVTTGGTGVSPRDQTPEGAGRVMSRALPGVAEELRRLGVVDTPFATLSRGEAGVVDEYGALVVCLPGSMRAVTSAMPLIVEIAPHVLDQLQGGDHG